MSPLSLYSRLALAEVITWALLLTAMVAKYGFGVDQATAVAGGVHGFVFLSYCVTTVAVWVDKRWPVPTGLAGLASSVIPFCTLPFEHRVRDRGLLEGPWSLARGGRSPQNPMERMLATGLRHPVAAAAVVLLVVAVVFALLLLAGPPTEWFA